MSLVLLHTCVVIEIVVLAKYIFSHLQITHTAIRKLFVYGTLKSGEPNHKLLKDTKNGYAKFICTATTNNKMPLVIATRYHIPFVLNKPGTGNQVLGEIYDVDEKMMSTCDSLENYNYSAEVEDIQIDLSNE